jgi:hypothetical protein
VVGGASKRWTAAHWTAFRRGYEIGLFFGRQDAPAPRPRADQLLRSREVQRMTGLGRTTLWQLVRAALRSAIQRETSTADQATARPRSPDIFTRFGNRPARSSKLRRSRATQPLRVAVG